ncbi:MAG: DNA polymerase I [Clostridia bacterium]|nr:DNA polymerase I [Clostridia bacterium]MBR1704608.1 DNA polymerase I [Clostridia bacterium]
MKLLVIDGNSIVNRAFFGIKLLTTKDGRFTNAITGFLNILLKLREAADPDAVAFAFDLKAPTFRHEMYEEYKAGRKGMPPELAEQMPVLKELLVKLGYTIVEQEGYEADDILGTLSAVIGPEDHCYIATGDRDSLQLVRDNVSVLLASTKMGRPQTVEYTPELVKEEYQVTPEELIEVKALQGDSSDNIPGVTGVGPKTAQEWIAKYHSIDYIYEHLEELGFTPKKKENLLNDKENAYLSRKLGTIVLDAPIDTDITHYVPSEGDPEAAARLLASLEMFKMIDKLGLREAAVSAAPVEESPKGEAVSCKTVTVFSEVVGELKSPVTFYAHWDGTVLKELCFIADGNPVYLPEGSDFEGFDAFLEDRDIAKYTSDSKPLFAYAKARGFRVENLQFDAALAGYILNPGAKTYDPVRLYEEYNKGHFGSIACDNDTELVNETLCLDRTGEYLLGAIDSNNQADLLAMEISLAEVLASMELDGFLVDTEGLKVYGEEINKRVEEMTARIYEEVGFEFNLNSPKQLGEALFEKLGLPGGKKTKTGWSTNAAVLEELADDYPIVADILEYRTVSKLKSTYCDGLVKVIGEDGRIHSNLNQMETRTGRISSSEPNLQNIPVRKPIGSELRKFFVAKPGYTLVDADYSQIELRVLASVAEDENMIAAFRSGEDIHAITASQVFGVPLDYVTPLMRSNAKAVNFGIVYGIGAFSLSKQLGISRKEADNYIKGYLHNFSGVDAYMKNVVEQAKKDGYVKTLYERRRYLPELTASNRNLRAFGERVAMNMPIQGTAADIIKIAMIKVYNRLQVEGLDARLIMQVHDELIVECEESIAEKVLELVTFEMEHAVALAVDMQVDAHIGKTWYDAKG